MNHVTIEDGCLVKGSIICSNAHLQQRAVLNYCQVFSWLFVPGQPNVCQNCIELRSFSTQMDILFVFLVPAKMHMPIGNSYGQKGGIVETSRMQFISFSVTPQNPNSSPCQGPYIFLIYRHLVSLSSF